MKKMPCDMVSEEDKEILERNANNDEVRNYCILLNEVKPCGKEVFWHLAISFCFYFIDETKLKFYIGCLMIDYFLKKQYNILY